MPKPKFNPNKPYENVSNDKPKFNPNLPFDEVKKKRIFSAYFSRRSVGIKLTAEGCVYFIGYRSTDTSTGIGYFKWRTA